MDHILITPSGHHISKNDFEELLPFISAEISPGYKLTRQHLDMTGSERQDVGAMCTVFSMTTASLFRQVFEGDEQKEAVADFVELMARGFQILQSRTISAYVKDKFDSAYRDDS